MRPTKTLANCGGWRILGNCTANEIHCADGPQLQDARKTGHTGRSGHRGRRISPHPFFSDETRQTCCQPYSSIARALPALNPFLILSSMRTPQQQPLLFIKDLIRRPHFTKWATYHNPINQTRAGNNYRRELNWIIMSFLCVRLAN
ncbi:hypothetical protein NPIL_572101 [Nephila pilipes]|uniref:Uncharacterized protein n=1 Tax=Nephila pilipes TaxID=299642 RepID=A0A8X6MXR4_NEPPI|nr:hypothetical protein NPIL_572101 [Nephila pilipes]